MCSTCDVISEVVIENVNTSPANSYKGAFFYSLAPKVQLAMLELVKESILSEDCVGVYYYIALNFELSKYVEYLRKCIKSYIDNFDAGLMDIKMDL